MIFDVLSFRHCASSSLGKLIGCCAFIDFVHKVPLLIIRTEA